MSEPEILALGEPLVEMVRLPGDTSAPGADRPCRKAVGGDALNVLVAAARQGARTGLISAVGDDPFGQDILSFCRAEGIDTSAIVLMPGKPTGVVHIDPDPAERNFTYAREGSAASSLGPDHLPGAMIATAKALHVTGISLAISGTMRAAAFEAARQVRATGGLVSFDLNFREKLWSAQEAAPVIESFMSHADIVLPSEDDVHALLGPLTVPEMLDLFARHGARMVILKRGSRGAVLAADGARTEIPAVPVKPVDSTGAGDSFAGAFLAHYLKTSDAAAAARRAASVAAKTVTGWGAAEAIPRRSANPSRADQSRGGAS